jgi:thiol-disulfide isomerase/thioredoxin
MPIVVVLLVAWGALSFVRSQLGARPHGSKVIDFKVGATLPDLRFESLDGKSVQLSQIQARVVLINFWATWCEACMDEMPSLVRLHEQLAGQGFEIYGVNLDEKPGQAIPATVAEFKIRFPNFIDRGGTLGDAFDVHAIPFTVIVDRSRKVLETVAGDRDWTHPRFVAKLRAWLAAGGDHQANR